MMVEAITHLRAYILIHNHETERSTGSGMIFGNLKDHLNGKPLPTSLPPLNLSQIVPQTANQVFKYLRLWRPFSFKPP